MATLGKKISAETSGSPPQASDEFRFARGGANFKVTWAQLFTNPAFTLSTNGGSTFTDGTVTGRLCPSTLATNSLAFGTTTNHPLIMLANNAEHSRFDPAGPLTLALGQVKFPASQNASSDANTLDDYEEGTFTPTVAAQAGTLTSTSSSDCHYTKNGRDAKVAADIVLTNVGTGTGQLIVSTPFTPAFAAHGSCSEHAAVGTGGSARMNASDAHIYCYTYNNGSFLTSGNRVMAQCTFSV